MLKALGASDHQLSYTGYEASTVWCNTSAAAKHKQELLGNLYQAVYSAVTMPQMQKMEVFRLAYLCEHIWPLDSDSPTCAGQAFCPAIAIMAYDTSAWTSVLCQYYCHIADNSHCLRHCECQRRMFLLSCLTMTFCIQLLVTCSQDCSFSGQS